MTTTPKERPILFSGPMVRAILDGRKTQTRRPIKIVKGFGAVTEFKKSSTPGYDFTFRCRRRLWQDFRNSDLIDLSPFGPPGTLLWVRETWSLAWPWVDPDTGSADDFGLWPGPLPKEKPTVGWRVFYGADGDDFGSHPHDRHIKKYRPSIHMPRWASRISLRVKRTWVERVQDISEKDARAEGMDANGPVWSDRSRHELGPHRYQFMETWARIYGAESWEENPWVWACEFERVQ